LALARRECCFKAALIASGQEKIEQNQ